MENVLLYFSLKYSGNWDKIYKALDTKERISKEEITNVLQKINCNFITILSPFYPNSLKYIHKPPFVLFYKGDINLISNYAKNVGIVGGKEIDDYGKTRIATLLPDLKKENKLIITNENEGVNEEVLDICKEKSLETIFILKSGIKDYLDKTLDIEHKNILFICECYEVSQDKTDDYIEYSNRLLCGLSKGIVFVQFKEADNFNNLINCALNEGKDIFAIPSVSGELNGTNKLIKMGGKLIETAKDIVNDI